MLQRVGAECARSFGDRKFQRLGSRVASSAGRGSLRNLGRLHPGRRQRRALQVSHRFAASRVPGRQGRSVRPAARETAAHGVGGVGSRLSMGRPRLDGEARRGRNSLHAPHVHLRSAPRLVDAGAGRAQPAADLSRDGAAAGGIRGPHGIHPRGIPARDGASVLRFVGISDHRLFRAHVALRHAAGFHVPGGLPAPARHRRDSRLGAFALPFRRARAGLFRRHASVRALPTRARDFIPTGRRTSSTTGATKCAAS